MFDYLIRAISILSLLLGMGAGMPPTDNGNLDEANELNLSAIEQAYIENSKTVNVAGKAGLAPLQAYDDHGEIQGISVEILNEISSMTGLSFDILLYDNEDKLHNAEAGIIMGVLEAVNPKDWVLTEPYLTPETVIFVRSGVSNESLYELIYAAYSSFTGIPTVNDKTAKHYDNFEKALMGVNSGKADFGYGNHYSVSFYQVKKRMNNLYTIPMSHIELAYSFAINPDDEVLQSIFTKALANISEVRSNSLKMSGIANSYDHDRSRLSEFVDDYSFEIILTLSTLSILMVVLIVITRKSQRKLKLEQKRQEIFTNLSSEIFFEYNPAVGKAKYVGVKDSAIDIWDENVQVLNRLERVFKYPVTNSYSNLFYNTFSGDRINYELYHHNIFDSSGKLELIIGKLEEVTEEVREKSTLIEQARLDGLTGFFNARYTKEEVERLIEVKSKDSIDILAIIDLDDFKNINDTHGHLRGNEVLVAVSEAVEEVLGGKGLWGRIGGDEFLIYLKDVKNVDAVIAAMETFVPTLQKKSNDMSLAGTVGMAFVGNNDTYEHVFMKADKALYHGKNKGKSRVVVYDYINNDL